MSVLTGRCACGEVGLTLRTPTLFASHCHCATCRAVHAAPFVTWTAVPPEALRIRGEEGLRWYASSPGARRGFCGTCGTPLLFRGVDTPDRVYVPVSVLDGLDRPVDAHVSYEEHVRWLEGAEGLPCFVGKGTMPLGWR